MSFLRSLRRQLSLLGLLVIASYPLTSFGQGCVVARGGGAGRRTGSDGAGLGLALVDEHIRMHGGRVWIEDRPDGESGARFVLELPATEATDATEAAETADQTWSRPTETEFAE